MPLHLADVWAAFLELSGARSRGFDACPITCADVLAWCDINEVSAWRRPMFWRTIRVLDAEVLKRGNAAAGH